MTDSNGDVADAHLILYQGVPVSLTVFADLQAAGDEFRAAGYTFSIVAKGGGYRSLWMQEDMLLHPDAYGITDGVSLAPVGDSRHGFGKAVDVVSNAPLAVRDRILAKHGFVLWAEWDRNHYEHGDVLAPDPDSAFAALTSKPLIQKENQLMPDYFIRKSNGTISAVITIEGIQYRSALDAAGWKAAQAVGAIAVTVSDKLYSSIADAQLA
jgi:hypothetical protein